MKFFAGPLRAGTVTILTALLLPVLGIGVASAQMSVGDTVMLKVPDLAEFPEAIQTHQFTCRAVTEHAYWLVQDSVSVEGTGPGVIDTVVWENLITQGELDTLTSEFEGNGIDVYGTVTEYLGAVPDTDDDPRIWIVMATIRDVYQQSPSDRRAMAYVEPADVDGSGTFNSHDIFYINIHTYSGSTSNLETAKELRRFFIPNGLGMLIRTAVKPAEDLWVVRGLGEVCQYLSYGITDAQSSTTAACIAYDTEQFSKNPDLDLTFWNSGGHNQDFAIARGQEFLWFMYLAQREGDSILEDIAQSDTTEMLNVARAIDPTVDDSLAVQTNVVPIYKDWLVCNLVSDLGDDMMGGIYTYEIFSDTAYSFGHIGNVTAFEGRFDSGDYPLPVWIPGSGMASAIWSPQYDMFEEYDMYPMFKFNGAYADANGSGAAIDGRWELTVVTTDTTTGMMHSVEEVTLNDLYNGSFQLDGDVGYLVLTNNNQGGAAGLLYILSQDTSVPEVLISVHQNAISDQHMDVYTTLYDSIPEGFDWYGPLFTATTTDTTVIEQMSGFYQTIWSSQFEAWEAANYTLEVAGYDSSGSYANATKDVAVGYVTNGKMILNINGITLEVSDGAAAPGSMISLCESNLLDLAVNTQVTVDAVEGMMTGILAGPVSIPSVDAKLSFPAESATGAVYRYTMDGWEQMESFYQGGMMFALVGDGGIYAYGDSPGVTSPVIPADFSFSGVYPNPFSAEAAIRFSLPSAGRVSVTIYDMSGRAIRTISDTEMAAAEHTLLWDGLDENGNAVGSGVYFCRLQACGETVTQKMLRIE